MSKEDESLLQLSGISIEDDIIEKGEYDRYRRKFCFGCVVYPPICLIAYILQSLGHNYLNASDYEMYANNNLDKTLQELKKTYGVSLNFSPSEYDDQISDYSFQELPEERRGPTALYILGELSKYPPELINNLGINRVECFAEIKNKEDGVGEMVDYQGGIYFDGLCFENLLPERALGFIGQDIQNYIHWGVWQYIEAIYAQHIQELDWESLNGNYQYLDSSVDPKVLKKIYDSGASDYFVKPESMLGKEIDMENVALLLMTAEERTVKDTAGLQVKLAYIKTIYSLASEGAMNEDYWQKLTNSSQVRPFQNLANKK